MSSHPSESSATTPTRRILIVANRTAAAPRLLEAVRQRAQAGPCRFTLVIPDAPSRREADWTLKSALPLLQRAARRPVDGLAGGPDPFLAVADTVRDGDFDEIIVSTLPPRVSKWLRRDLVTRLRRLGLPVTAIVPRVRQEADHDRLGDPKRPKLLGGDFDVGPV